MYCISNEKERFGITKSDHDRKKKTRPEIVCVVSSISCLMRCR